MPSGHELEWLSLEAQPVNIPAWSGRGFGNPASLTWSFGQLMAAGKESVFSLKV